MYNIEYSIKLCISVSLHEKYHNCTQKVHEINTTGLHKTRDKVLRQQLHGEPLKTTPSCIYCYAYICSTGTKIHTRTHIKTQIHAESHFDGCKAQQIRSENGVQRPSQCFENFTCTESCWH